MANEQPALDYVIDRMDKIESRLERFIEENTKRLDTLIELTRHMSAMNERQHRHSDDISDMKARLAQIETNSNASVVRINTRVDDIAKEFGKDMDVMKTSMIEKTAKVSAECETKQNKIIHDCDSKFATANMKNTATENELTKWLNRGFGAWFVLAAIAGGVEWYIKISMDEHHSLITELQQSNSQLRQAVDRSTIAIDKQSK